MDKEIDYWSTAINRISINDKLYRVYLRNLIKFSNNGIIDEKGVSAATLQTIVSETAYKEGWSVWRFIRINLEVGQRVLHPENGQMI